MVASSAPLIREDDNAIPNEQAPDMYVSMDLHPGQFQSNRVNKYKAGCGIGAGIFAVGSAAMLTYGSQLQGFISSHMASKQSSSWNELQSEMVDFVLRNSVILAHMKGKDLKVDPLLVSTFPHLENDPSVVTTLLPTSLSEWERVHWTLAYSTFLNFHGFSEEYEDDEELVLRRYHQWAETAKYVYDHNRGSIYQGGDQWKFELEMNSYSDKTTDELKTLGLFKTMPKDRPLPVQGFWNDLLHRDVPKSLDWRDSGCIQEVKNQQKCGSCWAFSATEAVESAVCVAKSKAANGGVMGVGPVSPMPDPFSYNTPYKRSTLLPNLSEQQLVDCASTTGNHGCSGGLMEMAFEYVKQLGGQTMCTETEYPYRGVEGECVASDCKADASWKLTGWQKVPKFSHGSLKQAIYQHGAVSVSVEADHKIFMLYKKGVIHDKEGKLRSEDGSCGVMLNHGVAAIGYGIDDTTEEPFWLVKNSWGPSWGEEGFIRLARDAGGHAGECGILLDSSFPVITLPE